MRGDRVGERRLQRGFSLIEAVFLIILLGAATAAMVTVFGAIGSSQSDVDVRQRGVLLAEACAERVFSSRRLLNTNEEGATPSSGCGSDPATETRALCDCEGLNTSGVYAPYSVSLWAWRLDGTVTPNPNFTRPSLCYQPLNDPDLDPTCIQVEIRVSSPSATLDPIFLQLSER